MTMNARIGSVFGAIFFGLIAIQNIIEIQILILNLN